MTPSFFLRFVMRNNMRILQQWWTTLDYIPIEGAPDGCIGEWRDVEMGDET